MGGFCLGAAHAPSAFFVRAFGVVAQSVAVVRTYGGGGNEARQDLHGGRGVCYGGYGGVAVVRG